MMCRVAAIAQRHQVGRFIRATEFAGQQVVQVRFATATFDATGHAPAIVAVKHYRPHLLPPVLLGFVRVGNRYRLRTCGALHSKSNSGGIDNQMLATMQTVKRDVDHVAILTSMSEVVSRRSCKWIGG